jgi:hypothetical protein
MTDSPDSPLSLSSPASLELLAELDLGSARGAKRVPTPLSVEVVRALTEEDLPELQAPVPLGTEYKGLLRVRHSHHQLAQVLARGSDHIEASLITGYSTVYIWKLTQEDPTFKDLLAHYGEERKAVFVDVLERMKVLGLSSLDELAARLEDDPEGWSKRELMEMAELMLVKGRQGAGTSAGLPAGPAVSVNVKFVTAQAPAVREPRLEVEAVDLAWKDLPEEDEQRLAEAPPEAWKP